MAIITSYFAGETYGLLGPQVAATIIEKHMPYECIVIAIVKEDDKASSRRPSTIISGRSDRYSGFPILAVGRTSSP